MAADERWPGTADRTDRELWLRLKQDRDSDAFADLFRRHADLVYNFCFRRLSSWSSAEDATQLTFTALWRRAVGGDIEELQSDTARPILLAMARGTCSNLYRGGRRELGLVDRLQQTAEPDVTDDIARWVEDETTMAAIRQELDRLPAKHRDVIELVIWADLPIAEAAQALRIPPGTVKSRLARARRSLAGSALLAEVVTEHR